MLDASPSTKYFIYSAVFCLVAGIIVFFGFLLHSQYVDKHAPEVLFGIAMMFAGLANCLAFMVFHRMNSAGFNVGIWRWPGKDFRLYQQYWRIAPERGWSRWVLAGAAICFALAIVSIIFCAVVSRP